MNDGTNNQIVFSDSEHKQLEAVLRIDADMWLPNQDLQILI